MIEQGAGPPLVMIPGIQGRWEWMAPAIDALSARHRVFSFSLRTAANRSVFDVSGDLIDTLLDRAGLERAAIVGVSFGGLIALRYAARRPGRVSALVLVSTPSPRWQPDERAEQYLRWPRWTFPLFVARAAGRLAPDVMGPHPSWAQRAAFLARHLTRVVRFPPSPRRMVRCIKDWQAENLASECARIAAPTLIVTGEAERDRVVPVLNTIEYVRLIPGARHVVLPKTGHIGLVSRPGEFGRLVEEFIDAPDAVRPGGAA